MSDYPGKSRQQIDVEEFERRLRIESDPALDQSDPLAELARLVEGAGNRQATPKVGVQPPPYAHELNYSPENFSAEIPFASPASEAPLDHETAPPPASRDAWDDDLRGWEEELRGAASREHSEAPAFPAYRTGEPGWPPARQPEQENERFASLDKSPSGHDDFEASLAAAFDAPRDLDADFPARGRADFADHGISEHQRPDDHDGHDDQNYQDDHDADEGYVEAVAPRRRSAKPLLWVAGGTLAVIGLVGGAFALRGGVTGDKSAPTIMAQSSPSKIQPDTQSGSTESGAGANVFDRKNDTVASSRVVTNVEQPVDINAQARAARVVGGPGGNSVAPPASAPVVPASAAPPSGASFFPEPKRVKTVSVRPDGSIIDGASASAPPQRMVAAPAIQAPPAPPVRPAPSTPTTASTPKPPVPKTTARVATTPRPDASAADSTAGATTAAVNPPPRVATPKPVTKPTTTASLESKPASGSGGFAVQFAAAGSEAEARDRIAKVQSQFASVLGGRRPGVVKGEANGKTVYRVRVGGVSREDALAMCTRVKESGGSCFVAGN